MSEPGGKTKAELLSIDRDVAHALRQVLRIIQDAGARIDHVELRIAGADRGTGKPVNIHIIQDNDPTWYPDDLSLNGDS